MSKMFVGSNDEIKIIVYVAFDKKGGVFAASSEEDLQLEYEEAGEASEKIEAIFRQPNFKDSVDLSADVFNFSTADGGGVDFNPVASRYAKMKTLIKSWNLKDAEGKDVPPTEENIAKLHPVIANAIGVELDASAPTI